MEGGMRSEQVYWVFTVAVDQMDKFTPLIPKLVAATEKEPGANRELLRVPLTTVPANLESEISGRLPEQGFNSLHAQGNPARLTSAANIMKVGAQSPTPSMM